jgi:hypothetical protein
MSKSRRFSRFWPFLWAIAHCFGVRGLFLRLETPGNGFEDVVKKSLFSALPAVFMGYCTQFGVQGLFPRLETPDTRFEDVVKKSQFLPFRSFLWEIAHCFGVRGLLPRLVSPVHFLMRTSKVRCFLRFCLFLCAIAHWFGVRGLFPRLVTLCTRFEEHVNKSSFFGFLAVFMCYCTLVWGPGSISMARVSQYTF